MTQKHDPIKVSREANGGYTIACDRFRMQSESISLGISGREIHAFHFEDADQTPFCLGGHDGIIQADISIEAGVQVRRELFLSDDGQLSALRFMVKNVGDADITLDRINPVEIHDEDSLVVADGTLPTWKVLRNPFHKNDIPSYFKPTVPDKDFEDAVFSTVGAVPGQGVLYNRLHAESRTISSGPMLIIRNDERPDAPGMLICATGVEKHFQEMFLTTTEDRQHFKEFKVKCTFDGILLKPGAEVDTHWMLVAPGKNESELVGIYTETVAAMYNLPPVKSTPPTVYCSWYFYTFNLNEQYLEDELTTIVEKHIPIDVFQIDDGWMNNYGSWEADPEKFPKGMKAAADRIKECGMRPGIWACPFVIEVDSPILKKYPDLMQRDANGDPIVYDTSINHCYIIDPTAPGAIDYLTELLTKLKSWGYTYFKLDWLRSLYEFEETRFRDPSVNRAMAYSIAMKAIRKIIGPDDYICGCGGLSDPGNFGAVNAQRTCKDVRGIWAGPASIKKSGAIVHIKQNILRNYVNRFYHSDPDGTQIRIRKERFFENERQCVGVYQSEGHYTDEEAFTIVVQQYVCGGLVMISERMPELQDARLNMLKHIAPSCGVNPARILDYATPTCPSLFLSKVTPKCEALGEWWMLAVGNWEDQDVSKEVSLDQDTIPADHQTFAVFEFHDQEFLGLYSRDERVKVTVPAHGTRVLRMTPWNGQSPKILSTDLHITGGGYEIADCEFSSHEITGKVVNPWQSAVTVTAGFPDGESGVTLASAIVSSGESFRIQA